MSSSKLLSNLKGSFRLQQSAVPDRIVFDLDATDDPMHGDQRGGFVHGYYGHYCYLPPYIFICDLP